MSDRTVSNQLTDDERGLEAALRPQGYSLMLCNSGHEISLEQEYLDMLPRKGLDGLIVVPHDAAQEAPAEIAALPLPKVILDQNIDGAPCVYTDFVGSANLLADALEQTGVERILLVTGSRKMLRHQLRGDTLAGRFEVVERIELAQDANAKRSSGNGDADCDAVVCTGSHVAETYLSSQKKVDANRPLACFDASSSLMAMPLPVMSCDRDIDAVADGILELLLPQLRGGTPERSHVVVSSTVKTNHALAVG